MRRSLVYPLILLLAFAPCAASAQSGSQPVQGRQQPDKTAKPTAPAVAETRPREAEATALQQRGLDLIRDAAKESVNLPDRRSAIRLQSTAGDLLWKHDQAQARAYFERAFEAASNYYRETHDNNQERVGQNTFVGRSDLRLDVIRLASRHDATLGRRLTDIYVADKKREAEERATQTQARPGGGGGDRLFGRPDQASGDLLGAAQSVLESDEKLSLDLALRSLAQGVSQRAPQFLVRLYERNRAAANTFYLAALDRVASENPPLPGQLLLLSAYPFGENRIFVSDGSSTNSYGFQPIKDFTPDAEVVGRFIKTSAVVLARVAELNPAQSPELTTRLNVALFTARLLGPKVAQYQPGLQDEWAGLTARLISSAQEQARQGVDRTLEEVAQESQRDAAQQGGSVTPNGDRLRSLLERAGSASDFGERDGLYQQAAFEAERQGDLTQALSIADKISDLTFKQGVLGWLHFNAATKAAEEHRYDDARRHALEVPATDQRAYLFYQIASAAWKQKDRVRAIEVLEEAARQADMADPSPDKMRAQLGIAYLYASIDSVRSFEILGDAMKTAGKVADYGVDQARLLRTLQGRGMNMTSVSTVDGFDLGKTMAVFARLDFERALGLAQSIENRSMRYETIMAVASTLFEQKPAAQTSSVNE